MTDAPLGDTAAGGEQGCPPAAGLDLGTRHHRDADAVAAAVVAALLGDPRTAGWRDGLVVTTHVVGAAPRHVALAVSAPAGPGELWSALTGATAAVTGGRPHALVLGALTAGVPELVAGAREAAEAADARLSGRAVHYPGVEALTGDMTVGELVERSAVERVELVTGAEADAATPLLTRDFVRPVLARGRLVLECRPAAGRTLVPFEVPDPTPCCADHA